MTEPAQVAIVTGGSRGIGRAVAAGLVDAGLRVAVLGRDSTNLDDVAEELGDGVLAVPCDVTNPAMVERALELTESELGPVDLLVDNAGSREEQPAAPWLADPDD